MLLDINRNIINRIMLVVIGIEMERSIFKYLRGCWVGLNGISFVSKN